MTDEGSYSLEELRAAAMAGGLRGAAAELVVSRAFEDQVCLAHASVLIHNEFVDLGVIASSRCSVCTGRTRAGQGDHAVCVQRERLGMPTPVEDTAMGPCHCTPCSKQPGGFTVPGVRVFEVVGRTGEAASCTRAAEGLLEVAAR
jgi:hypothetical protein